MGWGTVAVVERPLRNVMTPKKGLRVLPETPRGIKTNGQVRFVSTPLQIARTVYAREPTDEREPE